jgi:predicted DNA-binding transcriptional regulator AlpA
MDDLIYEDEFLTVGELSARIKFSKQTIYNLISSKEFILGEHYLKPRPKKILFRWSAIKAWMENSSFDSALNAKGSHSDVIKLKSQINI